MKFFLALMLSVTLVACSAPDEQVIENSGTPPELENPVDTEVEADLDLGNGVMINDFSQRQLISSPLEITGIAPRAWYFEGIVPITLMDLEENVIAEGYGSGAWLEPVEGSEEIAATDPIAFTASIEFTAPPRTVDMGKIRIAQDATGSDETGIAPEYVETMILWE